MQMHSLSTIRATSHFFPVLLVKTEDGIPTTIVEHLGTGFFMFPGVLITCWHCVADTPPSGHQYAIRVEEDKGTFKAYFLHNVERDKNGTDMATAICPYTPPQSLILAKQEPLYGEDVWAFGYPFSERRIEFNGQINHVISGRYLQGYISRHFYYEHPTFGKTDSYELDMPAPQGMSGAALLRRDTFEVVGLVFGSHDIATIEEFSRVDPVSGEREPEIQRITSFALAYDLEALSHLSTNATNGLPLGQYLHQHAAHT